MDMVSKADMKMNIDGAILEMINKYWELPEADQNAQIYDILEEKTGYAILSHRWLPEGELSYQEMMNMTKESADAKQKLKAIVKRGKGLETWSGEVSGGFIKLVKFCQVAWRHGCKYVWFDTGCINKESSAELEESIRSMFNWYRNSAICIVHLSETTNALTMLADPWFTRGWTLQELLAPKKIKFYGKLWQQLTFESNDKIPDTYDIPLWETISRITSIPVEDLLSFEPGIYNVRQRMAWASKRQTTRIEDMAYCLIGIFGVALSIAYGEGEMAFYRLQLEIVQRSDDKALFAWQGQPSRYNSMFAAGPGCFIPTDFDFHATEADEAPDDADATYSLTNRGLRISLSIYEVEIRDIFPFPELDRYTLFVKELGIIIDGVALQEGHKSTHLKIAILGDVPGRAKSVAVLLYLSGGTLQHTRIATSDILVIERPENLKRQRIFIT